MLEKAARQTKRLDPSVLNPFLSKEKRRALSRTDELFAQENDSRWDNFLGHAKRKSYVKTVQADPRADTKLKRHVDQMNRLMMGKVVGTEPGSSGQSYNIVRLRGGGGTLGCTCPDWRYKKSVAPQGEQDCKHIKRYRERKGMKKKAHVVEVYAEALRKTAGAPEITPRDLRLLGGFYGAVGGARKGGVQGALVGGAAGAAAGPYIHAAAKPLLERGGAQVLSRPLNIVGPMAVGGTAASLSQKAIDKLRKKETQKEAGTPQMALKMMEHESPAVRKAGNTLAEFLGHPAVTGLHQDVVEQGAQGFPFGPKFLKNTVAGRGIQYGMQQASAPQEVAEGATFFKRNWPGAAKLWGMLPRFA